jgi:uncharacterized protein with HEPN domain
MRSPILYLSDMLNATRAVRNFIRGMDRETFLEDEKTRSAVTYQLLILGEAAKAIPADIKSKAPNLDWKGMANMRDCLIHAYFDADYGLVWDTVDNEIPQAEEGLEKLIDELSSNK